MRIEAQYAYNKRKHIIALRLEADYEPEDWLGPLCINNLYYDFSTPEKFDEEWPKLYAQLKELEIPGCDFFLLQHYFGSALFRISDVSA